VPNDSDKNKAKNRRVDILVVEERVSKDKKTQESTKE